MDIKLILLKSVTLLYLETLTKDYNELSSSKSLVKEIIKELNIKQNDYDPESVMNLGIKSIIDQIVSNDAVPTKEDILSQIILLCKHSPEDLKAYETAFAVDYDQITLKKVISHTKRLLDNRIRRNSLAANLTKKVKILESSTDIVDLNKVVNDIQKDLMGYASGSGKDSAIIGSIDFNDETSINNALNTTIEDNNFGLLKTGFVGLNEALFGGIKRGYTIGAHALKHRYKTGFCLSLTEGVAIYNTPNLIRNKNAIPAIVHISFEDDVSDNLQFLYKRIMYRKTRQPVSLKGIDPIEMAHIIKTHLGQNGFHVRIFRVKPNMWNYHRFIEFLSSMIAEGYEIHFLVLDYLLKMPRTGFTATTTGSDIIDMIAAIHDFMSEHKIAMLSPFQLGTEAFNLVRSGTPEEEFVREVAGKGYTGSSKRLGEVLEVELYVHSFKKGSQGYLAIHVDKIKGEVINPDTQYMIYPFPGTMPVEDDIILEKANYMRTLSKNQKNAEIFEI